MDISEIIQGGGLVIGGAALAKLLDFGGRWFAARNSRTEVSPDPLRVEKLDKYVTRDEFARHVGENERAHENLFARLNRNDRETSEIKGMLSSIMDDLRTIKNLMMGGKK